MRESIKIKDELSTDLALRDTVDILFDKLEVMKVDIELDFTDIRSISRSFAHQYLARKKQNFRITEVNMPDKVEKMFKLVSRSRNKSDILDIDSMPAIQV